MQGHRRIRCGAVIVCAVMGLTAPVSAEETGEDQGTLAAVSADETSEEQKGKPADTETVVVTWSPLDRPSDELTLPVEQVSREEILLDMGTTIGEILYKRPGIATTSFAPGASRPVIRGQDAFRTDVVEDGLATGDVSRESPDHGIPVNPLSAQRFEVVRGPAVLRYGGGASAGVVNAITDRIPRTRDEYVRGEVFGAIDTVSNRREAAFILNGGLGDFAWHVDGTLRQSNDYNIPNDKSPNTQNGTFAEPMALAAGAAYIHERGRAGFSYGRFENDYGIPEDEDVRIDMETDRYRFDGELYDPFPGIREIRVRTVYNDYEHDEVADGDVGQTYRNEQFDGRVEALHDPVFGFVGAVGIQGRYRDYESLGEAQEFLDTTDTRMAAIYIFEERPLTDTLTGELGFRAETNQVEGKPIEGGERDRHFAPVSGALGMAFRPDDVWTVGSRVSISQRAPEAVELFARGAHEATGTFEVGDSDFDEETSYAAEVSVQAAFERVRATWSTFYTYYDDYIFGELQGVLVDEEGDPVGPGDDDGLDLLFYRERDAVFYGTEVEVEADLFDAFNGVFGVDGQFDFVRARFDDNDPNKNLPRITPIRWGGGAFYRGEWVNARVGFRRTEEQNKVGAFEPGGKTDSFTYVDASVSVRISLLDDRIPVTLNVSGENLGDQRARNAVAFNKDEVLLPGRNIKIGLRAQF